MFISEEDKTLIKKLINIKNRGYHCSGKQVTEIYNRVLNKTAKPTTCSTCIRARIQELENALKRYEAEEAQKKAQEALKQEEPTPIKEEEKQAPTEKKKRGRPKKEKEE